MPHGEVYCVSKISRMSSWRKVLHPAHGITLKTYFSSNILVVGHDMVDRPYKFSVTFTEVFLHFRSIIFREYREKSNTILLGKFAMFNLQIPHISEVGKHSVR